MPDRPPAVPQEYDRRFELLVGAVTDYAIYMLDPDGRIATWNAGAERYKGYKAAEILGEHYSRFFTPEDRDADLPNRALRVAAREGRYESEGWRVRKDGTRFWANIVLDPIRGDDGTLIGFAKITRDVTVKKEAQDALFESEQRFRMLVQGVRDYAIYMLDPTGLVSNWNSGAQAIKGYAESEIVGQHFSRFYTEEDRANGEPARALATALSAGKYETEAWRVRKDGTLFWANVVIDPIYDDAGRHVGFAKITRDATERRRAQEELEEARAAVAQSQKLQALGELTGGIAHDFNNLMTVIAGSAELLLRRPDMPEEKRRRYLEAIAETTRRATTLTSHLLAFGRRQPIRPEVIDLNLRLDAFGEVLSRTLGSRIDVVLDLAPALPRVEVDAAELETALLNAAFNARDAMPEGGRLTISTACPKGEAHMACIEVRDTGTGMSKEVLDRVFEPFFTTKEVGKGTGLGLSQIHGFAAQAGGRAEVQSTEGKGTAVRILLPASDKPLAAAAPAEAAPAALPDGLKVLVVEDNEQVRDFACSLLGELRCEVLAAADGAEALALLADHEVDLLFSDIVMPGMSGLELATKVRAERPDLPILLASGYSEEIARSGSSELEVLGKPYGGDALAAAIAKILAAGRRRAA